MTPQRKRRKIRKALLKKGFTEDSKRGHDLYIFVYEGRETDISTAMSRGSNYKEIGTGLISSMSRQLYLTRNDFLEVVDCDKDENDLIHTYAQKNII